MNLSTQKVNVKRDSSRKSRLNIYEMTLFAMFSALMLASKVLMEVLPNIHPLGMFIMALTVTYRKKALIPIYIYVFLNGLIAGFAMWWIPYLYIWTVLWGVTMLIPENISKKSKAIVYPIVNALFGLSFGILYAPAQALMFNLSFKQTVAWIAAGLSFDAIHAAGSFAIGFLVLPISELLIKLYKVYRRGKA
ncbi:MAG TPA: hypothetical protein VFD25_03840 [Clostridia bacterium]|nr:hypothetical protein [Clostridia bacterium]